MLFLLQVKEAAKTEFFKGAGQLVSETLRKIPGTAHVPNIRSLQRSANRARAALRPKHPTTLDFEVIIKFLISTIISPIDNHVILHVVLDKYMYHSAVITFH